jgi:beta-galactosidase
MEGKEKQMKFYNAKEFLLGVCYYPEQWNRSMWEDDFCRIAELGFNVVRMGESAWSVWEPEDGAFSFELFDAAIELCQKYNLKVILGTPTYAPPAWLTSRYPEVLRKDFNGTVMEHGSRRHYNYTSGIYLELCHRIVNALAGHYKDNITVIGWQIDNELNCHMDVSYADSDHDAFREWCRVKYKTLEALNLSWGTAFWSQTYDDWNQVFLPRPTVTYHNPSQLLDFYLFTSDTVIAFTENQSSILKNIAPKQFLTHNGMFSNIDYYSLTHKALDFLSFDSYPAFQLLNPALPPHFRDRLQGRNLSRVRGISDKFIILEQQAGPGGQSGNVLNRFSFGDYLQPTPKPGQMRLWAWQSIAHGADALLFFRWRTYPVGAEALWHGLNHYGNQPNRRLEEAGKLADEIKVVTDVLLKTCCKRETAILYDYANDSNTKIDGYIGGEEWKSEENIYMALNERHFMTDLLPAIRLKETSLIDQYRLIFYPNAQLLETETADLLKRYVENGGTLVLGPRSGYKDGSNHCYMLPFPGILKDLCGIEITDFTMVMKDTISRMNFCETEVITPAPVFNEILSVSDKAAKVLARYLDDYYKGEPAVVMRQVGKGRIIYFGTFFTVTNTSALLDTLDCFDPVTNNILVPKEVEVVTRNSDDGSCHILLNYTDAPQELVFRQPVKNLLTGDMIEGKVNISPFDIMVIK